MISSPICESRLPVGSSASRMRGLPTIARAIATRCCWPPDSCEGKWWTREVRPTLSRAASASGAARPPTSGGRAAATPRCPRPEVGDQVERLEDEPELTVADARERAIRRGRDRLAVELDPPSRRHVEQANQIQQRALAAARRPHDRDEFALTHLEVDVRRARPSRCARSGTPSRRLRGGWLPVQRRGEWRRRESRGAPGRLLSCGGGCADHRILTSFSRV